MNLSITGLHHVTAIASDPQRNLDFYVGLLGLRFVKRTVNFDDPTSYHFYFGDARGTPGTILTFSRGRRHAAEFAAPVKSKRRLSPFHQIRSATGLTVSWKIMFRLRKYRRVSERKLSGSPILTDS